MQRWIAKTVFGLLVSGAAASSTADVNQVAAMRAPVTAIALGPSRARVEINTLNGNPMGNVTQRVAVTAPVIAISPPFTSVTIRITK